MTNLNVNFWGALIMSKLATGGFAWFWMGLATVTLAVMVWGTFRGMR